MAVTSAVAPGIDHATSCGTSRYTAAAATSNAAPPVARTMRNIAAAGSTGINSSWSTSLASTGRCRLVAFAAGKRADESGARRTGGAIGSTCTTGGAESTSVAGIGGSTRSGAAGLSLGGVANVIVDFAAGSLGTCDGLITTATTGTGCAGAAPTSVCFASPRAAGAFGAPPPPASVESNGAMAPMSVCQRRAFTGTPCATGFSCTGATGAVIINVSDGRARAGRGTLAIPAELGAGDALGAATGATDCAVERAGAAVSMRAFDRGHSLHERCGTRSVGSAIRAEGRWRNAGDLLDRGRGRRWWSRGGACGENLLGSAPVASESVCSRLYAVSARATRPAMWALRPAAPTSSARATRPAMWALRPTAPTSRRRRSSQSLEEMGRRPVRGGSAAPQLGQLGPANSSGNG